MDENLSNYEGPVVNIDIERIGCYADGTRRFEYEIICDLSHRGPRNTTEWRRRYWIEWEDKRVLMRPYRLAYLGGDTALSVIVYMGRCGACGRVYQTWECVWNKSKVTGWLI